VQFYNPERGYVRRTVTPTLWKSEFMVVGDDHWHPVMERLHQLVLLGRDGRARFDHKLAAAPMLSQRPAKANGRSSGQ